MQLNEKGLSCIPMLCTLLGCRGRHNRGSPDDCSLVDARRDGPSGSIVTSPKDGGKVSSSRRGGKRPRQHHTKKDKRKTNRSQAPTASKRNLRVEVGNWQPSKQNCPWTGTIWPQTSNHFFLACLTRFLERVGGIHFSHVPLFLPICGKRVAGRQKGGRNYG